MRLLEAGDGLVVTPQRLAALPEIAMGTSEIRSQRQRLAIPRDSLVDAALHLKHDAQIVVRLGMVRPQRKRRAK